MIQFKHFNNDLQLSNHRTKQRARKVGEIMDEKKTMTIKDIAKICHVGVSTVSRAINNAPGINAKTREDILRVIEEYNYIPNNSARNLKMTESNTIALLIKGIDNQFFQGMLKQFEEELKPLEYSFIIHAVGEDQDDLDVARQLAMEKRLKGIIFLGGLMDHSAERFASIGVPHVLCTVAVNLDAPDRKCSCVSIDDEKESYKAVDYLCKKGHKRIAIICGRETDYAVGRMRLEGYQNALKANGIEFDPELVRFMKDDIPEYSSANGYAVAKELLESGLDFTAIYAISDLVAFGVYKAIYDAGKKIPDDYSVMGFDGLEMSNYYIPALTTIKQPCEAMVKSTIDLLMQQINGNKEKCQMLFKAELVERESVKEI